MSKLKRAKEIERGRELNKSESEIDGSPILPPTISNKPIRRLLEGRRRAPEKVACGCEDSNGELRGVPDAAALPAVQERGLHEDGGVEVGFVAEGVWFGL